MHDWQLCQTHTDSQTTLRNICRIYTRHTGDAVHKHWWPLQVYYAYCSSLYYCTVWLHKRLIPSYSGDFLACRLFAAFTTRQYLKLRLWVSCLVMNHTRTENSSTVVVVITSATFSSSDLRPWPSKVSVTQIVSTRNSVPNV